MIYELFIYGLWFNSGSCGSPALVGDNTQQGLQAGRPTRAKNEEVVILNSAEIKETETNAVFPSVKLYPNPAQGTVNIEYRNLPSPSRLVVANTLGVLNENMLLDNETGIVTISTANYANGIYIAQIKIADSSLLKTKFVILK